MIRFATREDLPSILKIYETARQFMRETGNATQWENSYPEPSLLLKDIDQRQLYVLLESGKIHAVFALIHGDDPTYRRIDDGHFLSDTPYATIHRIAGDGQVHGVLLKAVAFAETQNRHLRIDTHEDNKIMQHLITKCGFQRCGIIYLENGDSRIAYEKL